MADAVRQLTRSLCWVLPLLLGIRTLEYVALASAHPLPPYATSLYLRTLILDAALASSLVLGAGLWGALLQQLFRLPLRLCLNLSLGALLVAAFFLTQYFALNFVPLGSDLFGYSPRELRHIVLASGTGVSALQVLALALFFALGLWWERFTQKLHPKLWIGPLLFFSGVVGLALIRPEEADFRRHRDYLFATNKLDYFLSRSWAALMSGQTSVVVNEDYPLLHSPNSESALAPYFELSETQPNIVVILVEGLGSTLLAPKRFAGFMPYLESLKNDSLYWPNFMSTTGRTFGVLPAVLGSLPQAKHSFLELARLPHHQTLPALLKSNGYRTRYFHSGDSGFDNQKLFLKQQDFDLIFDQFNFPDTDERLPGTKDGFSWGFSDGALYQRSLKLFDDSAPYFHVYQTLATHEPFIAPREEHYKARVHELIERSRATGQLLRELQQYDHVLATFNYADEMLKQFMLAYKSRPEFENTIFVITGDHRMTPLPHSSQLARYHVPLFITSPLLKRAATFKGVSTHLDLTPALLGLLAESFPLRLPQKVHWLGRDLDTSTEFRAQRSAVLMRTKQETSDYLHNEYFLSGRHLYALSDGLLLREVRDQGLTQDIAKLFQRDKDLQQMVCEQDRLTPSKQKTVAIQRSHELQERSYAQARRLLSEGKTAEGRAMCEDILRVNPADNDTRVLWGRSFAWNKDYRRAKEIFFELTSRAPSFPDGHFAMAQVLYWESDHEAALESIDQAISGAPDNVEFLTLKVRILRGLGQHSEASVLVDELIESAGETRELLDLRRTLPPKENL